MTSSIPLKSADGRARLRDRKNVRHHGDHSNPKPVRRRRPQ